MEIKFAVLLVFQLEQSIYGEHICNYHLPNITNFVIGIKIDELPPHHRERRAASSNLRIHFDYQPSFTNSPDSNIFIRNIMEPSRNILQNLLIPNAATTGILRVDRSCDKGIYRLSSNGIKGCASGCSETTCVGVRVPDIYLKQCVEVNNNGELTYSGTVGSGVPNVDIVLLVTYIPCDSTTLAYAASCFLESTLDRPILGVINVCSNNIVLSNNLRHHIKTITHEIIHSLGFSVDKYAFYRYPDGTPIVPRNNFGWPDMGLSAEQTYYNWNDKIIKQFTRQRASINMRYTMKFNGFVLPNVLAAARNHFNCPSLESVDLENFGDSGSSLSHFDEYFLYNEMMTPISNEDLDILSPITLALLQDTGWYKVDYTGIENLDYGYKKGCLLPEQGCYTYMQSQKSNLDPFCNKIFSYGKSLDCSTNNKYFYYCGIAKYLSVHPKYQYFQSLDGVNNLDVSYYTGYSPYNEYCPTRFSMSNPSFVCDNELNNNVYNKYNIVPSYFGMDSMCFRNEMSNPPSSVYYGASCQKYKMIKYPNNLTIYVGQNSFSCPSDDVHRYIINGLNVAIKCPDDLRNLNGQIPLWSLCISHIYLIIIMAVYLEYFIF